MDFFIMAPKEKSYIDKVLEEFRNNGRDSEYFPESEGIEIEDNRHRHCSSSYATSENQLYAALERMIPRDMPPLSNGPVRDTGMICTFCRRNGEVSDFYRSHRLKDQFDRICCPILRRYHCPICGATGDVAHTIRYCPFNANPQEVPLITRLKGLRNSMGKRRGRYGYY